MAMGSTLVVATVAGAQETTTYNYDALGRLTGSSTAGGPNNNVATGTCFDRAGNRTRYDVNAPTPTPSPAPGACPTPTP